MLITKFFENQEIFITGGSGFIGKALIEKILRSCSGVGKVFVLLRGKKGKTPQERLEEILLTSIFDRARREQPEVFSKVFAIEGDCSQLGLGIKSQDLEKIKNVTVIYHSAASVRFDDALRDAILLNTRGTHELVKIAETMKKLKVFMHVSTTFCNPDKHVVEENIYPPYADWKTTIKLAEAYSTETLNIFNLKYGNNQPNTYTFTKSLAEQIINDYKDKLPMILFRPSIVISAVEEPLPGWSDNFNGPLGLLVACGTGILRTNYADPDVVSDFVPVDIVVRAMLVASYKMALDSENAEKLSNNFLIINCATSMIKPITTGELIDLGRKVIRNNPFEKTVWYPGGSITRCRVWNFIRFATFQILLALVLDSVLRISKMPPFMLKLQRRIYAANLALHVFATTTWIFKNENFFALDSFVPKEELSTFAFLQYSAVNIEVFLTTSLRGAKQFLLKESAESSKEARRRFAILDALHHLIILIGSVSIVYAVVNFIYKRYSETIV